MALAEEVVIEAQPRGRSRQMASYMLPLALQAELRALSRQLDVSQSRLVEAAIRELLRRGVVLQQTGGRKQAAVAP